MIYKKFQDLQLSALGLGAMRLPVIDGDNSRIDMEKTAEMVKYAIDHGVNYFDTAWGYHEKMSEIAIGEVLSHYPRDSFYLASKFPGYDVANMARVGEIFEEQLRKCKVDYFDFYLFHNVNEKNIDGYLDEKYGIFDYLMEQKKNGRIRHLGFSGHGSMAVLRRFLEKYGHAMEFGQLQLNWLDWELQRAADKYALLEEYNIPVWIMEPLRGGKLCQLEEDVVAKLRAMRPEETVPGWSFRFLQGLDKVTMVLSGMSTLQQVTENVTTFSEDKPLTAEENAALLAIADEIIAKSAIPCTACRYCTAKCPQGLDIPALLDKYNKKEPFADLSEDKRPTACLGCRQCEQLCPQGIRISQVLADYAERT